MNQQHADILDALAPHGDMIVLEASLRGIVARWAVQQSPYPAGPEGLGEVLTELTRRFDAKKGKELFLVVPATRAALRSLLEGLLLTQPQVHKWNARKNARFGNAVAWSHGANDPDDDFIDLDALLQNVVSSLLKDWQELSTVK